MTEPAYTYRAELIEIIDGDTARFQVDVGFRIWVKIPVRLAGINAPEHNSPAGQDAIRFVTDWFARNGTTVVVATQKNPEKYGRWLGTIIPANGPNLNEALVAAGHAVVWDGRGPRPVA